MGEDGKAVKRFLSSLFFVFVFFKFIFRNLALGEKKTRFG